MQAMFVSWAGQELVRVDVLHTISGTDLNATARALMREYWSSGGQRVDVCRIYLVMGTRLVLGGEENHVGTGIRQ